MPNNKRRSRSHNPTGSAVDNVCAYRWTRTPLGVTVAFAGVANTLRGAPLRVSEMVAVGAILRAGAL
jgi:hypothetical protein